MWRSVSPTQNRNKIQIAPESPPSSPNKRALKRKSIQVEEPQVSTSRRSFVVAPESQTEDKPSTNKSLLPSSSKFYERLESQDKSQTRRSYTRRSFNVAPESQSTLSSRTIRLPSSVSSTMHRQLDGEFESQASRRSHTRKSFAVAPESQFTARSSTIILPASSPTKGPIRLPIKVEEQSQSSSHTSFVVAPESQSTTISRSTRPTAPSSPRLSGRLRVQFNIQERRSRTRKKVRVDPKTVRFMCGINRFSDSTNEYMLRVNNGEVNLALFEAPIKLHVHSFEIRPVDLFKLPLVIGEARYEFNTQHQTSAASTRII